MNSHKNAEFFRIAALATDTAKRIHKDHRFDLVTTLVTQWAEMKAEALRIVEAKLPPRLNGPDCQICDLDEFWQEEFGQYWEAMRCAVCSGWECPNHHCPV